MNTNVKNTGRVADPCVVTIGPDVRFSYCNVFEPKSINGGDPRYSVSLIVSKKDKQSLSRLHAGVKAAYEKGKNHLRDRKGSVPPMESIRLPIRDGDTDRPDDPAYADSYFLNANTDIQPQLYDDCGNVIIDRSEVYSGCYGRASVSFFVYNTNGNRGIGCRLNALQKKRDGEPLGGRVDALAAFMAADAAEAEGEEDFLA